MTTAMTKCVPNERNNNVIYCTKSCADLLPQDQYPSGAIRAAQIDDLHDSVF